MSEPHNVDGNIFSRPIQLSDDLKALLQGGWNCNMDEAPKDGTRVLLYTTWEPTPEYDIVEAFSCVQVGHWDEHVNVGYAWDLPPEGWFLEKIGAPVAWMPLPKPPSI